MPEESSAWGVSTGLPDDFTLTVTDAHFAKSAEIKSGEILCLFLKGECDGENVPEDSTVIIQTGPGWDSLDGGKTARHESGQNNRKFNAGTHYGLWIQRAIELGVAKDLEAAGYTPTQAEAWKGRKFHLKQREFSGTIAGEERTWYKILPEAYLGEGGANGSAASAPAASAPAESNGSGNKVLMVKLTQLAKKSESHDDFVTAAMDLDGTTDDDAVLSAVLDDGPAGIYASARF